MTVAPPDPRASTAPPASRPITLAEMLAARDRRAIRQREAIDRHGLPVVSLTSVMPGPVKDTPLTRAIVAEGVDAVVGLAADRGWSLRERSRFIAATGAEALFAVAAPTSDLKRGLVDLEDSHPLGRLWDIDVLEADQAGMKTLSRKDFGLSPRTCLICGGPAHACARARAHPIDALVAVIGSLADAYFDHR
jgi:holo-ACP synthase